MAEGMARTESDTICASRPGTAEEWWGGHGMAGRGELVW